MSAEADRERSSPMPRPTCSTVRELLVPYIDGELDPTDDALVVEHVAACPGCRRELESAQCVGSTLDAIYAARPRVDLGMADRVRRRLEQDRRHVLRVALGVAASVLVLLGSWWLVTSRPERELQVPADRLVAVEEELPADELLENLDILEALDDEGVDLTPELVQLLLHDTPDVDDDLEEIFEYVLEEELTGEL